MQRFTETEQRVLRAGLVGGQTRDREWNTPVGRQALADLRRRGLVDWIETKAATGQVVVSVADGLSRAGIRAATELD